MKIRPHLGDSDWSNRNRPILWGYWTDEREGAIALDYGNGNSDAVWSVYVTITDPPRWLARIVTRLDRRGYR